MRAGSRRDEVAAALAGDASRRSSPPPRLAIARTLLDRWVDGLKYAGGALKASPVSIHSARPHGVS